MAQASNVRRRMRQHSVGDLERLSVKARLFEGGGRGRKARRMSDLQMDEIDNILFKDFNSPPDIEKKRKSLIPHLLALDRIKKFLTTFLREKAKEIAGNGENVTNTKLESYRESLRQTFRFRIRKANDIEFQWRKMVLLNRLSVLSFFHELMMKSLRTNQEMDKNKQRKLLELSNYIASAQVVITDFQSQLSKCYESSETTETELAQLWSKLDTTQENIEQTKNEAKFKINEKDLQQFCSVPSRTCHALGLRIDFLHSFDFENFPEDVQNHMSFGDWICNFLRESYNEAIDETPEQTPSNDAKVLESIGFRPDGMALDTILARTSPLTTHLELIDRVELFIRNEFKYNDVLSNRVVPRFPYNPLILNEWFPILQLSARQTCEEETLRIFAQPFCIAINLEQQDEIESELLQFHLEDETQAVLFHGTDHDSATDIIEQGIDINLGMQKRDFSDGAGFYLTDDLDHAVDWAFSKSSRPAVLVYLVPKEMLDRFSRLSLCSEDKQAQWKEIVSQFRSGKPSKKLRKSLREIDFIEGPQASSFMLPPIAREGSHQMCVISDELAEELQSCVHSVLFFDGIITDL